MEVEGKLKFLEAHEQLEYTSILTDLRRINLAKKLYNPKTNFFLASTGWNRDTVSYGLISTNQSVFWQTAQNEVSANKWSSLCMSNSQFSLVLDILDTCQFFLNSFFLFFIFMNNFCIAPCLFFVTKVLRGSNKNLAHLFSGWKT